MLRSRLLAVLAADVAGYSRLMSLDERATVAALDAGREVFRVHIARHGGRVVDMAGDSVMSVFDSVAQALQAALAVQRQLGTASPAVRAEQGLFFRIGIHVGEVIEKPDGTVYGDGVNIAARLEGLARPGAIAVSQAVHDMVARRVDAVFEDIGEQTVKHISRPVRAFRVTPAGHQPQAAVATPQVPAGERVEPGVSDLFGRDDLLERVLTVLRGDGQRLITLTGPGGSGKTRLALRAAALMASYLPDGARVVLLAPVREARHLMAAVALALGLQEGGVESLTALVQGFLRPRALLLVLDNLEHLPEAASQVAELLQTCPRLKVLLTSRTLLRVAGELELKVPPLALPLSNATDDALRSPAVALFAARAAAVGRDVHASAADLEAAATICRRLDGLPLAIEMAAARLRVFSPMALAARLQQSLPLLKSGAADAPQRQQTLRDTVAWSHDLLDPLAQELFRRLGVFVGGWTLEGAEAMAGSNTAAEALDALERLVDHNLVLRVDDLQGEPRFAMLETIREFALEQLAAAGEDGLARDCHACHLRTLACAGAPHLTSAGRQPWLLRLRAEIHNFRAALSWLVRERRDAEAASKLVAALTWLWYFDGLNREGMSWMGEVMELPGAEAVTATSASVVSGMARLAGFTSDMPEAHRLAGVAVERWRALGDRRELGFALHYQGVPALFVSGREHAVAALRESRQCFHDAGDEWGEALSTVYEGVVQALLPGAEEDAMALLEEGQSRCLALGDEWAASTCSGYIGIVALRRGDRATARRNFEHILSLARQTGDRFRIARSTHMMAELELLEGRAAHALPLSAEALTLAREQGRVGDMPQLLRTLARALVGLDRHGDAASLIGASERGAGGLRSTLPGDDPAAVDAARTSCRIALGDEAYENRARRLDRWAIDRVVDQALDWARAAAPAAST